MTLILKKVYTHFVFSILLTSNLAFAKLWLYNRERILVDVSSKIKPSQLKTKTVDRYELCPKFRYFTGRDIIRSNQRTDKDTIRIYIECRLNKCSCLNGVAAKNCHTHGKEECSRCNPNYHIFGDSCELNKCSCQNGIPAGVNTLENCGINGAEQCSDCLSGYHKTRYGTCERNICKCENGFPKMGNEFENLLLDLTLNIKSWKLI